MTVLGPPSLRAVASSLGPPSLRAVASSMGPPSLRAVASSLGPPSLRAVASPAELGPHNARFYYGILLENGSNVRGVRQHVTILLMIQSSID